jgi:cyanate lyase
MMSGYGPTLKELVLEMFGDGTISATNFKPNVAKVEDPEGEHRAIITLSGKYQPARPL